MKYYIQHLKDNFYGDRYWYIIDDGERAWVKYYGDSRSRIKEQGNPTIWYHKNADRKKVLDRSKEVTKKEWKREVFIKHL